MQNYSTSPSPDQVYVAKDDESELEQLQQLGVKQSGEEFVEDFAISHGSNFEVPRLLLP